MSVLADEPGDRCPHVRTPAATLEAVPTTASGEVDPLEERTLRRVIPVPVAPHRPSRSLNEPLREPVHPMVPSSTLATDRNTDIDDGATVMFARLPSASPESEATAMWNVRPLARHPPRTDETELLDGHPPGSPPTAHLGFHEASPTPTATVSVAPAALPVPTTQGPLPRAHDPLPEPAGPPVRALPPPSPPVSLPLTSQMGLLIVVTMFVVAGIGVLIGLLLAGRSTTSAPRPGSSASTHLPAPARTSPR